MKRRTISELKKLFIIALAGVIYLCIVMRFNIAIPCMFNLVTGLLCPACGITRMLTSIARLDFTSACGYNRALFLTLPIILSAFAVQEFKYIKYGTRALGITAKTVLWAEIAVLVIFGIVRNLVNI